MKPAFTPATIADADSMRRHRAAKSLLGFIVGAVIAVVVLTVVGASIGMGFVQ